MFSKIDGLMHTKVWLLLCLRFSTAVGLHVLDSAEEFCQSETFKPECLKSEVILMKSATYGRMRIGRCITAEEIAAQRLLTGDDPRILGCLADVLPVLDRKCSGKTSCEIRVVDMSNENIKPCYPGLIVYLEASYSCIPVVDEERSCSVVASKNPIHINNNSASKKICGTTLQPWTVEAPVGQKVSITLLDFMVSSSHPDSEEKSKTSYHCQEIGLIVDKLQRQNASICGGSHQREKEIYLSAGNKVQIFFNKEQKDNFDGGRQFLIRVQASGCSDIIPPEDAWLKRNVDVILIGCYSSRQTWQLSCQSGKWMGVLGNCSSAALVSNRIEESEYASQLSIRGQVLVMVAIGGFTLAIYLSIVCAGAICLRKFYSESKKKQEYKTLNCRNTSSRGYNADEMNSVANDFRVSGLQQVPTYTVYVEDTDFNNVDN